MINREQGGEDQQRQHQQPGDAADHRRRDPPGHLGPGAAAQHDRGQPQECRQHRHEHRAEPPERALRDRVAKYLVKEHKVAVVPGSIFGQAGEGYVRLSFAASMEQLKEGIARIGRGVAALRA